MVVFPLERKGNSNCDQRAVLLDKILSAIPRHRIEAIIGDREFMGEGWFKLLKERHMPFVMRIWSNITISQGDFVGSVDQFPRSKQPTDYGKVQIGSRLLDLSTTYSKGELVAVVSSNVRDPLDLYKQRWGIETGFKCLKSNGFNLEDTHLRHPSRIKMLVQICAIAMTFSLYHFSDRLIHTSKKKHGFPAISLFTYARRAIINFFSKLNFSPQYTSI